jgi:hypothetical protein
MKRYLDWKPISSLMVNDFVKRYPFTNLAVTKLSKSLREKGQSVSESQILTNYVDHLTFNLGTKAQSDSVQPILESYGMKKVNELVFMEGEVDGSLYWLEKESPFRRGVGEVSPGSPAIQGLFIRHFREPFLRQNKLTEEFFPALKDVKDLVPYLDGFRPEKIPTNLKKDIISSGVNFCLKNHILKGTIGHLAIDLCALGIPFEKAFEIYDGMDPKLLRYKNANPSGTINQLYVFLENEHLNEKLKHGEPPEPFLELIHRLEIASVTAINSVKV